MCGSYCPLAGRYKETRKMETRDKKVTNFPILSTEPKRKVGSKGRNVLWNSRWN